MSKQLTVQQQREAGLKEFKKGLDQRAPQYAMALPKHIPAERFQRVALTAVQNNPDLLDCSAQSVFNACMRAAQDGLLPDGREGAIVKYGNEAQWLPMVAGIMKKARNSGEIASLIARDVQTSDAFDYWIDEDGEHLSYRPSIERVDVKDAEQAAQCVRAVFAMAKLSDGTLMVEVMSVAQIERIRALSKAKKPDSPWNQWWGEMAKKTAIRRLSKRLPSSSDLDDLIRRDDELYDAGADTERRPGVLDLTAQNSQADEVEGSASSQRLAPPENAGGDGGKGKQPDNGEGSGGTSAAPPSPPKGGSDPTPLEEEIAGALLDAKGLGACDDVTKLYRKEIDDAPAEVRARIVAMVEQRKAAISADGDDFPGDR